MYPTREKQNITDTYNCCNVCHDLSFKNSFLNLKLTRMFHIIQKCIKFEDKDSVTEKVKIALLIE